MPTYEYRCEACRHEFEIFHSITENALRKCPKCGKLKLRRLIGSGSGIIFKGSGFYETDYKRSRTGGGEKKPGEGGEKK
jgi:putative FmdB family regulatory protein